MSYEDQLKEKQSNDRWWKGYRTTDIHGNTELTRLGVVYGLVLIAIIGGYLYSISNIGDFLHNAAGPGETYCDANGC